MQFKILPILAAALSLQSAAFAAEQAQQGQAILTAGDVVNTLNKASGLIADTAENIVNLDRGGSIVQSANVIAGDIFKLGGTFVADLVNGLNPFGATFQPQDQESICSAFQGFLASNQRLINVAIGPQGVFKMPTVRPIVSVVLNELKDIVEKFAAGLLGSIPVCQAQTMADLQQLQDSITTTFSTNSS